MTVHVNYPSPTVRERFLNMVVALDEEDGGCWQWLGTRRSDGRGNMYVGHSPEGLYLTRKAHLVAYELFKGPIAKGLEADHLCNRGRQGCVNPDHMELVTPTENRQRQARRMGRDGNTCDNGHVGNLYKRKSTGETVCCRTCVNDKRRAATAERHKRLGITSRRGLNRPGLTDK